jgi:hypothetical protein
MFVCVWNDTAWIVNGTPSHERGANLDSGENNGPVPILFTVGSTETSRGQKLAGVKSFHMSYGRQINIVISPNEPSFPALQQHPLRAVQIASVARVNWLGLLILCGRW